MKGKSVIKYTYICIPIRFLILSTTNRH